MTDDENSKHGFWNGKPSELKTLVWKLDREVWAKVHLLKTVTN